MNLRVTFKFMNRVCMSYSMTLQDPLDLMLAIYLNSSGIDSQQLKDFTGIWMFLEHQSYACFVIFKFCEVGLKGRKFQRLKAVSVFNLIGNNRLGQGCHLGNIFCFPEEKLLSILY